MKACTYFNIMLLGCKSVHALSVQSYGNTVCLSYFLLLIFSLILACNYDQSQRPNLLHFIGIELWHPDFMCIWLHNEMFLNQWPIWCRFAKRKLDEYVFLGNRLQVSYAPRFESLADTKEKLEVRRKEVLSRINCEFLSMYFHPEFSFCTLPRLVRCFGLDR